MKPLTRIYRIEMSKNDNLADSFDVGIHSEMPNRLRPTGYNCDQIDGKITLPWMERDELVAWFRKAADMIESAMFE